MFRIKNVFYLLSALIVLSLPLAGCGAVQVQETNVYVEAAAEAAPAAAEADQPAPAAAEEAAPSNSGDEIKCYHQNAGEFQLPAGSSANGGHIMVKFSGKWENYEFVDNKVVVVRNNSGSPITLNSTDGIGVCTTSAFDQVSVRFAEGCDDSGCSAVMDINVTGTNAPETIIYYESNWCGLPENKNSAYCIDIDN